ncbi:putative BURP domain-containing protein [Medicago truncatula]|uniref:Embryonic abundant-like protein n=3 Tax=Medicago truncatula TaxID=3880 RepID=G7L8G8_MEDTR|nr:embryonic abundant-like protein [Medicago truncatula]RHN40542.1 putative BURP domain-containing protein [Medicago truncatula]
MELTHLSVLAIFFLALVGINGSKSGEEYWKSVWPNTLMPKSLSDLLLSESGTSVPIQGKEEKQYWTVFFEHDLYPGKKMSLGIQKHSDIQPSQSHTQVSVKKASQSFGTRKWLRKTTEKVNQPFGVLTWVDKATKTQTKNRNQPFETRTLIDKSNQPFGFFSWTEKETEADSKKANPAFEAHTLIDKTNQPFGFFSWTEKEIEAETKNTNQHFETPTWNDKTSQPFGFFSWTEKATESEGEIEKANEPFETRTWNDKTNQPFGFFSWTEKEIEADTKNTNQHFETPAWNDKTSQPFGFFSWTEKATEAEGEIEKANEPFETRTWNDKTSQPLPAHKWTDKAIAKETEKTSQHQHFVTHTSDENEAHILEDYCGRPSAIGEDKHCAPSLESMMDFAISKLGKNIKVMSSSFSKNHDQYVVEEVNKIGDNAVMCHRLNFKKVLFYCHQVNATTTYMVPLVASDGTKSKALTICHHDTRGMDPNVLYDVLKVKPGTVPVCHFIGNKAVAWVPNDDVTDSNGHPSVF